MLRINQLKLPVGHREEELTEKVKKLLKYEGMPKISIVRRSVDARKKPVLYYNYILNVEVKNQSRVLSRCGRNQVQAYEETPYRFPAVNHPLKGAQAGGERPIIIGTGPAGLFCGYMLAEAGLCPILLERGKPVEERARDVHTFWETGKLDPESNVQFGEGGAGTFSDGKLNTLVKDKYGRNRKVLSLFVRFGAPEEILYDHNPHIGTDILGIVVANMRREIRFLGGEVRFGAKVTDMEQEQGQITGVMVNGGERIAARQVVLAPGHSARDTFSMLYEKGVRMEAKPFAVGLRVEHPQELVNLSQYGVRQQRTLGSASYKLTAKSSNGRGVYSFCMCPGGYVVNASSEPGRLAVNGMSYSGRDGANANSAIIVTVTPEDFGSSHPLGGIAFQQRLEEKAYQAAEGSIPVERYGELKRSVWKDAPAPGDGSVDFPENFAPCIRGAWKFAPVHGLLPERLMGAFIEGMEQFGGVIKGFNHENVLVEGIESRTSSPVRIIRDETGQCSLRGLYPCGEGAGYAGGITSAAMDGILVAEMLCKNVHK